MTTISPNTTPQQKLANLLTKRYPKLSRVHCGSGSHGAFFANTKDFKTAKSVARDIQIAFKTPSEIEKKYELVDVFENGELVDVVDGDFKYYMISNFFNK